MSKFAVAGAYTAGLFSGLGAGAALVAYLDPDLAERIADAVTGYVGEDEHEPMIAS